VKEEGISRTKTQQQQLRMRTLEIGGKSKGEKKPNPGTSRTGRGICGRRREKLGDGIPLLSTLHPFQQLRKQKKEKVEGVRRMKKGKPTGERARPTAAVNTGREGIRKRYKEAVERGRGRKDRSRGV